MENSPGIAGITRFSIVCDEMAGGFRQTRNLSTYEEIRARIWNPERMATRFALFEAFTLPSMQALADSYQGFAYFLGVSEAMPQRWHDALAALVADKPWCHVVPTGREKWRPNMRAALLDRFGDNRFFNFRIDDDDALAPTFIPAVLSRADAVPDGTLLSFTSGINVQCIYGFTFLRPEDVRNVSVGLGLFSRGPNFRFIFETGRHSRAHEYNPVEYVSGAPMWIRTRHLENDSGQRGARVLPSIPRLAARKLSASFPSVDWPHALKVVRQTSR